MMLLLCLRGNVFVYYGEELGLTQVDIAFADLRDPEAIANWPRTLSRDGARTPMPWCGDARFAGFSDAKPWLPVGADHPALAVDQQERDPGSLLTLTRRLIALRRAAPALSVGTLSIVEAGERVLAFERRAAGQNLLCVFNTGSEAVDWRPADAEAWRIVERVDGGDGWRLPGYAALVAERIV